MVEKLAVKVKEQKQLGWNICPLAYEGCINAQDKEIFMKDCSRDYQAKECYRYELALKIKN